MMKFTLKMSPGGERFERAFNRFGRDIDDFRDLWKKIALRFWRSMKNQFDTEGAFGGSKWKALKLSTIKRKGHARILYEKGALMASLTRKRAKGSLYVEGKKRLEIGTEVDYAGYHQTGTRHFPARPPVALPESEKKEWSSAIHAFMQKKYKENMKGLT